MVLVPVSDAIHWVVHDLHAAANQKSTGVNLVDVVQKGQFAYVSLIGLVSVGSKESSFASDVEVGSFSTVVLPLSAAISRVVDVISVELNEVAFSERLALYKHSLIS